MTNQSLSKPTTNHNDANTLVILRQVARCFFEVSPGSCLLYNSGFYLDDGDEVYINEPPFIRGYDHGEQEVIAFVFVDPRDAKHTGFFLRKELSYEKK